MGSLTNSDRELYNIGTSELSGDESQPTGSHSTISVAVPGGAAGGAPGSLIQRHFAPPTDPLGSLAPFRSSRVELRLLTPRRRGTSCDSAPVYSRPAEGQDCGEPRPRPEPADGDEPPSKRPPLVVSKPTPGKVLQKARPKIRVRLAQDVQEVEPESYDVRERSPLRSASSSSAFVRPSAVPPSSAPQSEGAAHRSLLVHLLGRRSAPCEGAASGVSEEERGSVRRFLSPEPESERPATKAALGLPEPEPEIAASHKVTQGGRFGCRSGGL